MTLAVLDPTTRLALIAAANQQAQCEALIAAWEEGNVTVRLYGTGDVLRDTVTLAPFTINAGVSPRRVECGARVSRSHAATGDIARLVFRAGSTDVFSIDASSSSGASVNFAGVVKALCAPRFLGVTFEADPTLPASGLPLWRQGRAAMEWVRLTGTSIANTLPAVLPSIGTARNRVEAWNGLVVRRRKVERAGVGGHADWAGNEGYSGDLGVDVPGPPVLLNQPTPAAFYTSDQDYYLEEPDGKRRPTSSHTYYGLHSDELRDQIVRLGVGSGTGTGNYNSPSCDAFDVVSGDWLPANTLADCPENLYNGLSQAKHPVTGDIYAGGITKLWRWNRADRSWTDLGLFPPGTNGTACGGRAMVVDVARNRLVILGNAYNLPENPYGILVFDLGPGTWDTTQALSGVHLATVVGPGGNAAFWHPGLDRYIVRRSWSAVDTTKLAGGEVLQVHPDTLVVSDLPTTGGASIPATLNGVWGLWQYMPDLECVVFEPRGDQAVSGTDLWALCLTAS